MHAARADKSQVDHTISRRCAADGARRARAQGEPATANFRIAVVIDGAGGGSLLVVVDGVRCRLNFKTANIVVGTTEAERKLVKVFDLIGSSPSSC